MRIGICSWWFNRGQAVVGRHLRSALDELGHETFVLARPARPNAPKPSFIDRGDVWDQPGVTEASAFEIPLAEYEAFAADNEIDTLFFDQNYQLEEIATLRRSGVRTIGRFVWEAFKPEHVPAALEALDVVYSMTGCERERYRELGIESPRVHWGIHPELLAHAPDLNPGSDARTAGREAEDAPGDGVVRFLFPGGYMTKRKPLGAVIRAFGAARDPRARLLVKAQVERKAKRMREAASADSRIELIADDLATDDYQRLFAAADVCLAPSRWEGLGLHLYEATALGLPIITNDNPPMNEIVEDGVSGLLVRGRRSDEPAPSGVPAFEPDVGELTAAIEALSDDATRARLAAGTFRVRDRLSWSRTLDDLRELLAGLDPDRDAATP
jgi:glycosyltransferase involved in cell wall biosynthesis